MPDEFGLYAVSGNRGFFVVEASRPILLNNEFFRAPKGADVVARVGGEEAERLRSAIPDFGDEVKGEVIRKEIKDYAKSVGWTDQELSQVYDHRAVLTLYRAMQYEKLQKSKPAVSKRVAEAPKSLAPGVGSPRLDKDGEAVKKLTKQLKQSGRPRDAAALFERFL